jgi:hypothetical protein
VSPFLAIADTDTLRPPTLDNLFFLFYRVSMDGGVVAFTNEERGALLAAAAVPAEEVRSD